MKTPHEILEKFWGFTAFRPKQEAIITTILQGHDTLVVLPTGGGKSICFQVPALALDGICIVVSPLIALIEDQVANLKKLGIKAIALTGGIKHQDIDALLDNCIYGDYKFLYLSPERLQQHLVLERLKLMNISFVAIDEAHCISQWGNDFRPAYKHISILRELKPTLQFVALTATATPKVIKDIEANLQLQDAKHFKQSFYRENLSYHVVQTEDKYYKLEQILKRKYTPSIIYTRNRKRTQEISNFLNDKGFVSTFYHGGLDRKEKTKRFESWLHNEIPIMVATSAFGMGIDKSDVRSVIHIELPESLESYYQEAGRAGRNGEKAFAVLLKDQNDAKKLENQFLNNSADTTFLTTVYRKLNSYFQIAYGEGLDTSHAFSFLKFTNTYQLPSLKTYNALQVLDRHSIIHLSQNYFKSTTIQFIVDQFALDNYLKNNPQHSMIVKILLRTYGGLFDNETKINVERLAFKIGLQSAVITSTLQALQKHEMISLSEVSTDATITFLVPREDDKVIYRIAKEVKAQIQIKKERIASVLHYIEDTTTCKSNMLCNYFGEDNTEVCGSCSVCRQQHTTKTKKDIFPLILEDILIVLQKNSLDSRAIVDSLTYKEALILEGLQYLLESKKIILNSNNTYSLYERS